MHLKSIVEKIAECQGTTVSEYLRRLIIEDLDKRSIFTVKLKEGLEGASNPQKRPPFSTPSPGRD